MGEFKDLKKQKDSQVESTWSSCKDTAKRLLKEVNDDVFDSGWRWESYNPLTGGKPHVSLTNSFIVLSIYVGTNPELLTVRCHAKDDSMRCWVSDVEPYEFHMRQALFSVLRYFGFL